MPLLSEEYAAAFVSNFTSLADNMAWYVMAKYVQTKLDA
jgi:hypothetical protein